MEPLRSFTQKLLILREFSFSSSDFMLESLWIITDDDDDDDDAPQLLIISSLFCLGFVIMGGRGG